MVIGHIVGSIRVTVHTLVCCSSTQLCITRYRNTTYTLLPCQVSAPKRVKHWSIGIGREAGSQVVMHMGRPGFVVAAIRGVHAFASVFAALGEDSEGVVFLHLYNHSLVLETRGE